MAQETSTGEQRPTSDQRVAPPTLSLPKGGGAIRGMGEKFAANPVTGTGSLSVPIATSPGRAGFGPQLSLSYDSGAGNGPFGFGWSLALPAITRKTDKGLPQYRDAEESDVFLLSGAEDLVPLLVQQADGSWDRPPTNPVRLTTSCTTVFGVTAHASRACLHASNAGPTRRTHRTPSGAPFPKTTSPPGTAKRPRAVLPILLMTLAFLAGSSAKATMTRATSSSTATNTKTLTMCRVLRRTNAAARI
jgi:hypothetical protein